MAGSRTQALGGVDVVDYSADLEKVRNQISGGPKPPSKTFKIIIPNELHKDKRHIKNI